MISGFSRFWSPVARGNAVASVLRAVVLVEGRSDQVVLETVAERRGWRTAPRGVAIVPMGGIHALPRFLESLGPDAGGCRVAGLYDAHEESVVRQSLHRLGYGPLPNRAALETRGFFACDADLEDELIRAVGAPAMEALIAAEGDHRPWRRFQQQPAQRSRPVSAQLRRFLGTKRGRKIRYARLLAEAVALGNVPRPLDAVLALVEREPPGAAEGREPAVRPDRG